MSCELIELGRILVSFKIPCAIIKDIRILETADEHGYLMLRMIPKAQPQQADLLRLKNTPISLMEYDGTVVFDGVCLSAALNTQLGYAEVTVFAATKTVLADQEKKTKTFQSQSKTMKELADDRLSPYGITVKIDQDFTIPEMLSQEAETDWAFIRRIANQYGKLVFVDSKSCANQIHIGTLPFSAADLDPILNSSVERNIQEFSLIQANLNRAASAFEFETRIVETYNLAVGAGHMAQLSQAQIVMASEIVAKHGYLTNTLRLRHKEGAVPSMHQARSPITHTSILTGTVKEISGTNVRVEFTGPDDMRWIPYENLVSNYFYCMPDIGDTVFVYYEVGDSDKISCLGSRHVNDSPDFGVYQDKMLTANNKMIKFSDQTLDLAASRKAYDGEGGEYSHINFDKQGGIQISSTQKIIINGEKISVHSVEKPLDLAPVRAAFNALDAEGAQKFEAAGGENLPRAIDLLWNDFTGNLGNNIIGTLQAPLHFFETLSSFGENGRQTQLVATHGSTPEPEYVPPITTGLVTILGGNKLIMRVQSNQINFSGSEETINVHCFPFYSLGTDRSMHFEHLEEENYTWFDVVLDGAQLILDIVGTVAPAPIGTVANGINAAVSLSRGDYVGAATSAAMCAASLIPGGTIALGSGKLAKAAKAVTGTVTAITNAAEAGNKLAKAAMGVVHLVKFFKTAANALSSADAVLMGLQGAGNLYSNIVNGTFDPSDPTCWRDVIDIGRGVQVFIPERKDQKGTMDGDGQNLPHADGPTPDTPKHPDTSDPSKVSGQGAESGGTTTNNDTKPGSCCNGLEPVNLITGAYLVEQCDIILNDISGDFPLLRYYNSQKNLKNSLLGSKWMFSLSACLTPLGDVIEILMNDMHIETFLKTPDGWRNRRGGDESLQLYQFEDSYKLVDISARVSSVFDLTGRLLYTEDRNGNRTLYEYVGGTLRKVILASGQTLTLDYAENKLSCITDSIGRKIKYTFDGEFLVAVEAPNGGIERYEYDTKGYIREITNAEGITYVHNDYDAEGRITRQVLSTGQEYICLYDDSCRTNTVLTPQNGKEIRYVYNKDNLMIKTIYQDGTEEEVGYDECQNIIWRKDRRGAELHRVYDIKGRLLEERLPNGLVSTFCYDENGNLIEHRDNSGWLRQCFYDSHGNMVEERIRIDQTKDLVRKFEYDSHGRIIAIISPSGEKTCYRYEAGWNKPTEYTTPEGETFKYSFDGAGRRMTISSALGTVRLGYNNMDFLCLCVDSMGNTQKYVYDLVFNLKKVVLPNNFFPKGAELGTEYEYDPFHNLIRSTDELGHVLATLRDGEGNIVKEINPNTYDSFTQDGEGIINIYDPDDRKVKIVYPTGEVESIKYDSVGNIIKKIQPAEYDETLDDGPGFSYEYDCANRLVQITSPDGTVLKRYVYNLSGSIIKEIDTAGFNAGNSDETRIGTLYTYNDIGWMTEKREPVSISEDAVYYRLTRYLYDQAGHLTDELRYCDHQTEISACGMVHTISYAYDRDGRMVKVSDCTGAVLEYGYNCLNKRTFEKRKLSDGLFQVTQYEYDSVGRMVAVTTSADKQGCGQGFVSTRYSYDKTGNITRIQLPGGGEILREYDAANRLIAEEHREKTSGIQNRTQFDYDAAGNLVRITDLQGRSVTIEYDLLNREIRRTDKDGGVTRRFYDPNGRLARLVRPNQYNEVSDDGAGFEYVYDLLGRVTTVIGPNGVVLRTQTYDENGHLLQQLDADERGASFEYDFAGNRIRIRTAGGTEQQFTYDAWGNITGVTDGNGGESRYLLDKWGRITGIIKADGSRESYEYDLAGNIIASTDGEGHTTQFEYNRMGKLAAIVDPLGEREEYHYDGQARLVSKTDRNGVTVEYGFNLYGAPLFKKAKDSALGEFYEYTPEGLLKCAISAGMRYAYEYDAMGRMVRKSASGRTLLALAYDMNGNKICQTDVTGKVTEFHFDLLDILKEVYDNGVKLAEYEHSVAGMLLRQSHGPLQVSYGYDQDQNLTALKVLASGALLADNHYQYDGNGNRILKQQIEGDTRYFYDGLNQLTKIEYPTLTEELFYDKAGNRTRRVAQGVEEQYVYDPRNRLVSHSKDGIITPFRYDHAGNLLADDKALYSYDAFNRTERVETFDGNIQINRYDAEGLRYEMEENGNLVRFIFNQNREAVSEEDSSGLNRLIRGTELIASHSSADSARTYYHYASDEIGSTTHITDEDGKVLNRYAYDAFGNLTEQVETVPNRFKYNGQQLDPITQQYYLRARFYNPVIARFTQEDLYRGDGLNLYAYCQNNPVIYADPSGYSCQPQKDRIAEQRGRQAVIDDMQKNLGTVAQNLYQQYTGSLDGSSSGRTLTREQYKELSRYARTLGDSRIVDSFGMSNPLVAAMQNQADTVKMQGTLQSRQQGKTVLAGTYKNGETTANLSGLSARRAKSSILQNFDTPTLQDIQSYYLRIGWRMEDHPHYRDFNNGTGYYNLSHTEKQVITTAHLRNTTIDTFGVSSPICPDCASFLIDVVTKDATYRHNNIYAVDSIRGSGTPNSFHVFLPNGTHIQSLIP